MTDNEDWGEWLRREDPKRWEMQRAWAALRMALLEAFYPIYKPIFWLLEKGGDLWA